MLASILIAASAAASAPSTGPTTYVGAQVGALFPVGLSVMTRPSARADFDFSWEPSGYLQSYSIGAAYHPGGRGVFVGARFRLLQLHAPWTRAYVAGEDNHLALGAEVGLRRPLGTRWLATASLGAFRTDSRNLSLPALYTLNLGIAYRFRGH